MLSQGTFSDLLGGSVPFFSGSISADLLGGSVVGWLGRRTLNPVVPGSSPALTASWSCFSVAPSSTPRPRL